MLVSVTPSSADASLTAFSPIRSALRANASSPWYQWTRISVPVTVCQVWLVSAYSTVAGSLVTGAPSAGYAIQVAVIDVLGTIVAPPAGSSE